jgi:hypothetical protein
MNVKLHTPKSLKTGSGMSSMKQFLLSLLATTVSIALTFGTAAIVDHNKKQSEKREIVMMVMYDMYTSLKALEKAGSNLHQEMDIQLQLVEDTTRYDELKFKLLQFVPKLDYTETTERIFSSSIETINTVGNVLFTENVASFYQSRKYYKEMICDSILNDLQTAPIFYSLRAALSIDFATYALAGSYLLTDMRLLFSECKQMMDVTDDELEAYRVERKKMGKELPEKGETMDSVSTEIRTIIKKIEAGKKKLNIE